MGNPYNVVLPNEADHFVSEIKLFSLEEIGSKQWWLQDERLGKLSLQVVLNVTNNSDEYVKDYLILHNKLPTLIGDLIVSEFWNENIYPQIKKRMQPEASTIPIYMSLYHSISVCGLLEVSTFYEEICEASGDNVIDLIDYASRRMNTLLSRIKDIDVEKDNDELGYQYQTMQFALAMKALSIVKNISDHLGTVPLSALTRMLNIHDFICLLCNIMEASPWKKEDKDGNHLVYDGNKWIKEKKEEALRITKIEGQLWLALYQLLLHPESQRKYDMNSYRKSQVLKLRRYLNEVLFNQIPQLSELQRYLEYLAVTEPPAYKQDLIIEQVPEIFTSLHEKYDKKYEDIAKKQMNYFILGENEMKEQVSRFASTYNLDVVENLIEEPPICANCYSNATSRCSRCQNEWYCSRPCQVKHWSKHKPLCSLLVKAK